ncbi:hypothetical protein [Robertkochia solimangrovi]|uniref:hypothetical protein n=1 Tax=Robertkochia solimangrovi TaxID=2213046 RepID=UPI00117DC9B6|nr:hypothetical protein [Robertkochia solimangrovi]TRZ43226.1 hypothetical protein DMZ48_11090 [Robertkochia solimangrovi]
MLYDTLESRIDAAPSLDFGAIFSKAIELFKKSWLQGFLYVLLSFVLVLPALLIIYIPMIGMMAANNYSQQHMEQISDLPFLTMLPFMLLFFVVMLLANSIVMALNAGYYRVLQNLDMGKDVTIGEIFVFLKWVYIKKTLVLSLLVLLISLVAAMLFILPMIYVSVPLYLITVIFAFNPELTPIEVLKAAFKLGTKKWFIVFGLVFVAALASQLVGLILCGIGTFFTASFVYNIVYYIYKDAVGFEEDLFTVQEKVVE